MRMLGRLGAALLVAIGGVPAVADAGRVCTQPIAIDAATTYPSAAGLDVSTFAPGLVSADLELTSGTIAADLETQVGDAWVVLGSYTNTGKLKIDLGDGTWRLNVGTCTACVGTFTVCGHK